MDTPRYAVAVLVMVTIPPVGLFWFLVHPVANYWSDFLYGIHKDLLVTMKAPHNSIMLEYPEVSINGYPGKLLTDGIYGNNNTQDMLKSSWDSLVIH